MDSFLDSIELAKKLEERCALKQQNINVLIQVNLSQEKSKFGVNNWLSCLNLRKIACGALDKIKGTMTIPEPDLGELLPVKYLRNSECGEIICKRNFGSGN
ncbi:MAG: hypothetical protein CM1200mP28_13150 [Deltaproteobacteria bacterium]|nr:MAG: hypothetical protein CM1200mP28_13150 [Deltaproteobacteria bacterium]